MRVVPSVEILHVEPRVRCGDARTRLHAVEVVPQPEVTAVSLEITPPAYNGRPAETRSHPAQARPTGAETLALLVGSQVAVEYRADQDLETAAVTVGGEPLAGATFDPASRMGRFAFRVTESVQITIDLVNKQGFHAVRPTVLAIEAVADRTPVVNLTAPAAESEQVPAALVPLAATVEDDLAIAAAAVVWQLNPQLDPDAPFRELPLEIAAPDQPRLTLEAPLDLEATEAVPGDEIVACGRVADAITALIEAVRPAMPGLAALEAGTRARLTEVVAGVAATLARAADEPGRAAAREWFRRRLELLDLDPFVAGGEILTALAAAGGGEPPAVPPAAAVAEREWWRWLAAEWEREQLAAVGDMADDERKILTDLLAARLPAKAPATPFADAIAAVAAAGHALPNPKDAATAIVTAIDTVLDSATADPVARAASVAAFDRAAELAVRSAAARSRVVQLAAGGSFADDALLLRLRDALLRQRQNARLAATDAAGDPEGWRRPLAGLEAALGKLLAAAEAGELTGPATVEKSPFLLAARQSRALERAAATGDRGILARDWPEASDLVLSAGVSLLGGAAANIEAGDRALAAEPPDRDAWRRARSEIERGLAGFAALAAASEELTGLLADVKAKLAAVDRPTGDDAAAMRARRLALGELRPAVAVLARRAAVVAERADADPGGFEGGPEQIQGEASRREALLGRRMDCVGGKPYNHIIWRKDSVSKAGGRNGEPSPAGLNLTRRGLRHGSVDLLLAKGEPRLARARRTIGASRRVRRRA